MRTNVQIIEKTFGGSNETTYCNLCAQINFPNWLINILTQIPGFKKFNRNLSFGMTFNDNLNRFEIWSCGYTKLQEGDIFNEELGKRIAYLKAKEKLYKIAAKLHENISEFLLDVNENVLLKGRTGCLAERLKIYNDLKINKEMLC